MSYRKLKNIRKFKSILNLLLPAIISAIVLYFVVVLISKEGGPTITALYTLSLFIAAGYFMIAAAMVHIIYMLRQHIATTAKAKPDEQIEILKELKKEMEKRYYRGELDEKTFEQEMKKIGRKIMFLETKKRHDEK